MAPTTCKGLTRVRNLQDSQAGPDLNLRSVAVFTCTVYPQAMPEWTETTPLRVVTGYHGVARRFFAEKGFRHVQLLSADGALEAHPAMGSADIILDLVSRWGFYCAALSRDGAQTWWSADKVLIRVSNESSTLHCHLQEEPAEFYLANWALLQFSPQLCVCQGGPSHDRPSIMQVSTGVTLRENNLKEIEGGHILDSQGILVGSRRALRERAGLLEVLLLSEPCMLWSPARKTVA